MQISATENTKLSLDLFAQEFSEIYDCHRSTFFKRVGELRNYYIYQDGLIHYFNKFTEIKKLDQKGFLFNRNLLIHSTLDEFDSVIYYFVDHPKDEELLLVMKFGHKNAETN